MGVEKTIGPRGDFMRNVPLGGSLCCNSAMDADLKKLFYNYGL